MSKEIYISSTPHETRLAIVENDDLTEIYYERENEYTLAGSIYNGKVTRVLPGMQSSFVDVGLERDAFLYITDFLEEAGESADFDAGEGRRGDGRRGDRPRTLDATPADGDRPALAEGAEPRSAESMPERSREPGSERSREPGSERSRDRNGRRQRGGGRDGRGARPAAAELGRRPEITAAPPALSFHEEVAAEPTDDEPAPIDAVSLGEGAPAAEGSRRWRGRRGRRRGGRGGARETLPETQAEAGAPTGFAAGDEEIVAGPDLSSGYDLAEEDAADDPDDLFDPPFAALVGTIEASAAPEVALDSIAVDPIEDAAITRDRRGSRSDRRESASGGRSDRGSDRGSNRDSDRGRDRREGGRSGRRDTAYSSDYGQPEAADSAPAEPILLPGESLAKYRGGASAEGESAPPQASAPVSTPEFRLPGAWDGGSVLPGETLRPRPASTQDAARPTEVSRGGRDDRGSRNDRGGRDERGGRNDRGGRDDRGSRGRGDRDRGRRESTPDAGARSRTPEHFAEPQDATQSAASYPAASYPAEVQIAPFRAPAAQAGPTYAAAPVQQDPDGFSVATPTEATHILAQLSPAVAAPTPTEAPTAETAEPSSPPAHDASTSPEAAAPATAPGEAEYEPTEGSASYRVDPASPREFRQAAEPVAVAEVDAPAPPLLQDASPAHRITPAPGQRLAPIHFGAASEPEQVQATPDLDSPADLVTAPGHEVTAISLDGEMLSALPAPPPAAELADPTSPIEHETAVLDVDSIVPGGRAEALDADLVSHIVTDDPATDAQHDRVSDRAVDGGLSEEAFFSDDGDEIEDEEDFHTTTLHAAAIEEIDYEDDEIVETSADLGGLLRDMSIDQLTRTADGTTDCSTDLGDDDEFAFEEEDSLGDEEFSEPSSASTQHEQAGFAAMQEEDQAENEVAFDAAEPARDDAISDESRGQQTRTGRRDGRDGRRGGRDRGRSSGAGGERSSNDRGSNDRSGNGERGNSGGFRAGRGREGHRSAQTTNLPAISDLLKPGQELLVQIAKEPIAKKGARITSHIALPGRFLVFMPTVNHTGVSRKIESDGERRRLKEILLSEKGEATGGFIVRTAASGASEEELRSDLRFLLNLWADIKQRSESSKSPALIYHDLNLVERILRDQVTDTFSAIWVDNETDYERILRFLQRFQPSLIRRVKLYTKETPLFEQFGISEEINKALRSKVWLKSGGSIVINQTEALVAIDINTGKYVGKTARLEDTIVKTNLDAIPEIVRQIRLRDLGGIIIIDFIDMDERKNRARVMMALEDELKKDRAPSKVLQFNDFGLVAITRKRVKQSLERTLSTPCAICTGTGMIKSPVTVCNDIYMEMRKMQKHLDRGDVMLRVNPEVVKQLKSPTARWLQEMEEMVGKTILVKSDPTLHPEQFDIH